MANYLLMLGILALGAAVSASVIGLIWFVGWIISEERKSLKRSLK